jgi:hypothetical protein
VLSALALCTHAANAVSVYSLAQSLAGPYLVNWQEQGGAAEAVDASSDYSESFSSTSARAEAAPGRLSGHTSADKQGASANMQGRTTAEWKDQFVINSPGRSGEQGYFSGSALLGVTAMATSRKKGSDFADDLITGWMEISSIPGRNPVRVTKNYALRAWDEEFPPDDYNLRFDGVPFHFGEPIDVILRLYSTSTVNGFGTASSSATLTWDGLAGVTDSTGALVSSFTALSPSSNFNFVNPTPVPEASTAAMHLLGASMVLLVAARRRRPSHRSNEILAISALL